MKQRFCKLAIVAGIMMCCGTAAQLFAEGADSAAAPAAEPAAAPAPAPKPAGPQGSVYGKVYADYYYDVSDTPIVEKSQIELSRVYLGYKEKIDDHFTADVLLDVARLSTATSATGTYTAPSTVAIKLTSTANTQYYAYLKTAYLAWKDVLPMTTLSVGQIPYFAFDVQESFWGHRYLYKTLMDNESWESSADLGAKVQVAPIDMLKITIGVTNGEGYKAPQDAYGKYKFAGAAQVNPIKDLTLYVYGDLMPYGPTTDTLQTTAAAFAGYNIMDMGKIGVEYDAQFKQKGVTDHNVNGLSVEGMYSIIKPVEVFARYDLMGSKVINGTNWNPQDGHTVIAGVQYSPISKVKFAMDYQGTNLRIDKIQNNKIYINGEFDY